MPSNSSTRPPGSVRPISSTGIRTILPSSSHRRVIGSTRADPLGRQADGHLVDDAAVEDVLDLVDAPEQRARPDHRRCRPIVRAEVADDAESELAPAFDPVGEPPGARSGADDEHVMRVVAAIAKGAEGQPDRDPRHQGDDPLEHEQDEQEPPADVGQLEQEQDGKAGDCQQEVRPEDVLDLAPDRPAGAEPVQVMQPQDADPCRGVDRRDHERLEAGAVPPPDPVGPEQDHREDHEQDERAERVHRQQTESQRDVVPSDQAVVPEIRRRLRRHHSEWCVRA